MKIWRKNMKRMMLRKQTLAYEDMEAEREKEDVQAESKNEEDDQHRV